MSKDSIATYVDEHVHVYARGNFVRGAIQSEGPILFSELHTAHGDVLRIAHLDVDTAVAWLARVGLATDRRALSFPLSTRMRTFTECFAYAASGLLVTCLVVMFVSVLFHSFFGGGAIHAMLFPLLWAAITVWAVVACDSNHRTCWRRRCFEPSLRWVSLRRLRRT